MAFTRSLLPLLRIVDTQQFFPLMMSYYATMTSYNCIARPWMVGWIHRLYYMGHRLKGLWRRRYHCSAVQEIRQHHGSRTCLLLWWIPENCKYYLLPFMPFDAISIKLGFEGLCPPGIGIYRYADVATVLMDVLLRVILEQISHLGTIIVAVWADPNNGYDLMWRIMALGVTGFDPTLYVASPVWDDNLDIFKFAMRISYTSIFKPNKDCIMMRGHNFCALFNRLNMCNWWGCYKQVLICSRIWTPVSFHLIYAWWSLRIE
jgi:hypothetical protein